MDTSYSKEYYQKLKGIVMNNEQTKWLSDKMTTIADQVALYKCSGKKCNAAFSEWERFLCHTNLHYHIAKKDAGKTYMIAVVYTIPRDTVFIILLLLVALELNEFGILFLTLKKISIIKYKISAK